MKKRGSCVLTRWQHDGGMVGEICFLIRRAVMPSIPGKWPQHAPLLLNFGSGMATASPTMPLQARRPLMKSQFYLLDPHCSRRQARTVFRERRAQDWASRQTRPWRRRRRNRRLPSRTIESGGGDSVMETLLPRRGGGARAICLVKGKPASSGSSTTVMLTRESARSGPSPRKR